MKKIKLCKDCKKKIQSVSTRCKSCADKDWARRFSGKNNPNFRKNKQTKEEKLEKARNYQKEHKTRLKHYLRKYNLTANGIFSHLKQGAKRRHIKILFTKKEFEHWYNKQKQVCYYCARTVKEIINDKKERTNLKFRLSIERTNNKKGYSLNNIVLACARCNMIKGSYFTAKQMLKIGKIAYK